MDKTKMIKYKVTVLSVYIPTVNAKINLPTLYRLEQNKKTLIEAPFSYIVSCYAHQSYETVRSVIYCIRDFYIWCEKNKISPLFTTAGDLSLFTSVLRQRKILPTTVFRTYSNVLEFLKYANEHCGFQFKEDETKSQIIEFEGEAYKIPININADALKTANKRKSNAVVKVKDKIPTIEEVGKFLDKLKEERPFVWGIAHFSAFTSLRLSEVLQFKKSQADEAIQALKDNEDYKYFYIKKGDGASRKDERAYKNKSCVTLTKDFIQENIVWLNNKRDKYPKQQSQGYFFITQRGKALTDKYASKLFKQAREYFKFFYVFHKFRAFHIDNVANREGLASANIVAKHKNRETTMGYTSNWGRSLRLESTKRLQNFVDSNKKKKI